MDDEPSNYRQALDALELAEPPDHIDPQALREVYTARAQAFATLAAVEALDEVTRTLASIANSLRPEN